MISDILRYIIYHRAFLFSRFDVQFLPGVCVTEAEASKTCLNLQVYDNIVLRIFTSSTVTL